MNEDIWHILYPYFIHNTQFGVSPISVCLLLFYAMCDVSPISVCPSVCYYFMQWLILVQFLPVRLSVTDRQTDENYRGGQS